MSDTSSRITYAPVPILLLDVAVLHHFFTPLDGDWAK